MSITSRLTEYGLLGAFFIFAQLGLIVFVFPEQSLESIKAIQEHLALFENLSFFSQSTTDGLFAILGLICIFFLGLILDLIGYYIPIIEISGFKKILEKNRPWLERFLNEHGDLIHKDTEDFLNNYKFKSFMQSMRQMLSVVPFSKKYWKIARENWKVYLFYKNYRVIIGFLTQYCLAASSTFNPQVVLDQMHIWRVSKGISTALIILSSEILVAGLIYEEFQIEVMSLIGYLLVYGVAFGIAQRAHNQLCESLLTSAYLIHSQQLRQASE